MMAKKTTNKTTKQSPETVFTKIGSGDMWVGRKRTIDPGKASIISRLKWLAGITIALPAIGIIMTGVGHLLTGDTVSKTPPVVQASKKAEKIKLDRNEKQEGIKKVGNFGAWEAFVDNSGSQKTCYIKTESLDKNGHILKIEHNPQWNWFNQVKYEPSSSLEKITSVKIQATGTSPYEFAVNGNRAWLEEHVQYGLFHGLETSKAPVVNILYDDKPTVHFYLNDLMPALDEIDAQCKTSASAKMARTVSSNSETAWMVGQTSDHPNFVRSKKRAVDTETGWLWMVNHVGECEELAIMFTLETFHTDLHFLENRKGQKIRMLWNDRVIPSKVTVISPKIGTVENGKVVLQYKDDSFIKRLKNYKEDQVIKTQILDTNDILVDEYFEVKTHTWELIGLKNALKQQKELCTALAAKAEGKSSDIAVSKMKEPNQESETDRNSASNSPKESNKFLWDVGRFQRNPTMFTAQTSGQMDTNGKLAFFNNLEGCPSLATVFTVYTSKRSNLDDLNGKTIRVVWNDTVQKATVKGLKNFDGSGGVLLSLGHKTVDELREFYKGVSNVSMQLLDTGDVVIDRYFDKAKNVWLLDGMDDAISETVGLCFIAEARKGMSRKEDTPAAKPEKNKANEGAKKNGQFRLSGI